MTEAERAAFAITEETNLATASTAEVVALATTERTRGQPEVDDQQRTPKMVRPGTQGKAHGLLRALVFAAIASVFAVAMGTAALYSVRARERRDAPADTTAQAAESRTSAPPAHASTGPITSSATATIASIDPTHSQAPANDGALPPKPSARSAASTHVAAVTSPATTTKPRTTPPAPVSTKVYTPASPGDRH
ncbi:MAG: hypothetical protein U0174_24980 [Polyangiaceae bacterium]